MSSSETLCPSGSWETLCWRIMYLFVVWSQLLPSSSSCLFKTSRFLYETMRTNKFTAVIWATCRSKCFWNNVKQNVQHRKPIEGIVSAGSLALRCLNLRTSAEELQELKLIRCLAASWSINQTREARSVLMVLSALKRPPPPFYRKWMNECTCMSCCHQHHVDTSHKKQNEGQISSGLEWNVVALVFPPQWASCCCCLAWTSTASSPSTHPWPRGSSTNCSNRRRRRTSRRNLWKWNHDTRWKVKGSLKRRGTHRVKEPPASSRPATKEDARFLVLFSHVPPTPLAPTLHFILITNLFFFFVCFLHSSLMQPHKFIRYCHKFIHCNERHMLACHAQWKTSFCLRV